jgi:hypothetical protein
MAARIAAIRISRARTSFSRPDLSVERSTRSNFLYPPRRPYSVILRAFRAQNLGFSIFNYTDRLSFSACLAENPDPFRSLMKRCATRALSFRAIFLPPSKAQFCHSPRASQRISGFRSSIIRVDCHSPRASRRIPALQRSRDSTRETRVESCEILGKSKWLTFRSQHSRKYWLRS